MLRTAVVDLGLVRQRFESGLHFDTDVAKALGVFESLRGVAMTETLLRASKIGAELNQKAWRRNRSNLIATESSALVRLWRNTVYAERGKVPKERRPRG
mmetsp:Transcript_74898/g.212100  ORF Transcript_74898/g.212100 Transcript_74898/m.212100 type:complete len:99 (+) Transcript_74898:306-602(+)